MPLVQDLHHASLIVQDTATALTFYQGVLDLELDETRPDLGYPGAWLRVGVYQVHLLELPNPDPVQGRPDHGGRDRHVAFKISDLDRLVARLRTAGIGYSVSRSGRRALFCRDPDGNALEFVEIVGDSGATNKQ